MKLAASLKTAFKYDLSCVLQQGNAQLLNQGLIRVHRQQHIRTEAVPVSISSFITGKSVQRLSQKIESAYKRNRGKEKLAAFKTSLQIRFVLCSSAGQCSTPAARSHSSSQATTHSQR
jgi:hypothetical protein